MSRIPQSDPSDAKLEPVKLEKFPDAEIGKVGKVCKFSKVGKVPTVTDVRLKRSL
jgi:hypothetical protein